MTDTSKSLADERAAFEKWHDSLFDVSAATAVKSDYGYPQNSQIQTRWQAWQAARALSVQQPDEFTLLGVLADIRQKTGVGDKPMLSELADTLAHHLTTLRAENERLKKALEATQQEIIEDNKILRAYILNNLPLGGAVSAHFSGLSGDDIIANIIKAETTKIEYALPNPPSTTEG